MPNIDQDLKNELAQRFAQLPPVLQNAITSADVDKHLQELAKQHSLHLDQWGRLENEVQMSLLGIQPIEKLAANLQSELNISQDAAEALSQDISHIVFEPIRQELERQLEHPAAQEAATTGVEDMRAGVLAENAAKNGQATVPSPIPEAVPATPIQAAAVPIQPLATPVTTTAQPSVLPATPPVIANTAQVARAPVPTAYTPATPSHERKTIEGDPYREQLT